MIVVYFLFYLLAAVCFALYTFGATVRNVHLLGLGVFFWSLVPLTQTLLRL